MAARKLSPSEGEAFDRAERRRREVGGGIKLSDQPMYGGPEVLGLQVGPYRHTGPVMTSVTVTHDSGRVSIVSMLPASATAWVLWRETGDRAVVRIVVDRFGTDAGGDLRLGLASFHAEGEDGQPVSPELLARLHVRHLAALVVAYIGHLPPGPGVDLGEADTPGRGIFLNRREALDYIEPGRMRTHDPKEAERERVARVWWDAKVNGNAVGEAVAAARGHRVTQGEEGAGARAAAYVYVDQLKRRGVLARVGRGLGHDPAAYGADAPKPKPRRSA